MGNPRGFLLRGFSFDHFCVKHKNMRAVSPKKVARMHDFLVKSANKKLTKELGNANNAKSRERVQEIIEQMIEQLVRTKAMPAGLRVDVLGGEKILQLTSNKRIVNSFRLDERERAEAAAESLRKMFEKMKPEEREKFEPRVDEVDLRDQVKIHFRIAEGTPREDVEKLLPFLNGRIKLVDV